MLFAERENRFMKKFLPLVALVLGFAAQQASADVIFTSENLLDDPIHMSGSDSYSFTHDLTVEGYVPGTTVLDGELSIYLTDDRDRCSIFGCPSEAAWIIGWDVLSLVNAGQSHDFELGGLGLLSIWYDGLYTYTVRSAWGDFYFWGSSLSITAESVPEPATLAMLGLGLLGFGAARRRQSAAIAA
jgi:hypothetical protein